MIHRKMGYLTPENHHAGDAAKQLETQGYVLVPGVLSSAHTQALAEDIHRVFETQPPDRRTDRPAEAQAMFRYAMLNRSAMCQETVAHRGILDVIEPLLGEDCHVIANTAWRNPPNSEGMHGGEAWHIDAGPHIPLAEGVTWPAEIPHPTFAIGAHIYLRQCTMEDGPTGVLPGSHLSGQFPPAERRMDSDLTYRGQSVVPLLAQPGDVGFFVSDIWHRRMPTRPGDQGRFFLQVHYGRRDIAQRILTTQETNHLSDAAIARAQSDREKTVVGIHTPMFYDG